jgi:uncharacterized membrane protein YeaQ/YmgE (transglycosylase-associated protein family)
LNLSSKKWISVIIVAAIAGGVTTLIAKYLGIENASPIVGGAVGGAFGGAIASNFGSKKK